MARIDKIKQALRELEPEDKIDFHNLMCSEGEEGDPDDQIYENDEEFFNMFYANDVFGAVQRAVYGEYNPMHDYVTLDGYANLQSIEKDRLDRFIDDDKIARFLDANEQYLEDYNLEIEDEEKNEVSEEQYYDALEVLPPFYFDSINGKKVSGGFAVGEPTSHTSTPEGFRATYSGYYKSGGKYFGVGQVYFVFADEDGEPNDQGSGEVEVKTLDPDAFAKGGGVRRPLFSNREYSYGRNWTNDHRHENKSENWEVPQGSRKRKFSGGGGVSGLSTENLERRLGLINEDVTRILKHAPNDILHYPVQGWENIGTLLSNIEIASDLTDSESDDWKFSKDDEYATGGGVRTHNGREYSFGRAWTNDHRHENRKENWEVPQADRVRQFATGGNTLTPKQEKIDMNHNGRIDAEDFAILRKSMNGAWRNEHKHVNHSEKHETRYAKKTGSNRTGYKGRKEYGTGGSTDKPKEPIAFETSNLYYNGKGKDINGNSVVRVSFPNSRAFSIQTNGTLPKTHREGYDEMEINEYVKEYGSPAQKKKLKIYK
jgi:hypothetical protein